MKISGRKVFQYQIGILNQENLGTVSGSTFVIILQRVADRAHDNRAVMTSLPPLLLPLRMLMLLKLRQLLPTPARSESTRNDKVHLSTSSDDATDFGLAAVADDAESSAEFMDADVTLSTQDEAPESDTLTSSIILHDGGAD